MILLGLFNFMENGPHELVIEFNYFENMQQLRELEILYGIIIKEEE